MAGLGASKTGGREAGPPNKPSPHLRGMILAALDRAGGEDYLLEQATANPRAFLSLVGRLIPAQVTGKDDAPLIPKHMTDPDRLAHALLLAFRSMRTASAESTEAEVSCTDVG